MPTDRDEDQELDAQVASAWDAQPVPPGFADRVVAARAAEVRPSSTVPARAAGRVVPAWWVAGGMVLAAAASALVVPGLRGPGGVREAATGNRVATERQEVALGGRGIAVLEAGADVAWDVGADGTASVTQRAGGAFYRVEKGGIFTVHTPTGDVTVLGTCFNVEITDMNKSKMAGNMALGAAMGVLVTVTVYEGRVALANPRGEVTLVAGESARASPEQAPRKVDTAVTAAQRENERLRRQRDELQAQVDEAETQVRAMMQARAAGKDVLAVENERLVGELRRLKDAAAAQRAHEQQKQGQAVPFPDNLPEAYKQDGLRQAFVDALREAGVNGDVRSIDCNEFPCVVYGDGLAEGGKEASDAQIKAMEEALKKRYPEKGHSMHESVWTNGKKDADGVERQRINFAISVYPDGLVDEATREQARKRLRWRNQEYMEAQQE